MPENTSEKVSPNKSESTREIKPERVVDSNNKIIRKLRRLLVDYPEAQGILRFVEMPNYSERIPTFDETPSGGLDMTKEWGNTISSQDGEKSLRVQPPSASEIIEEGIHMSYGDLPRLEVRISPTKGPQLKYSNSALAFRQGMKIVERLGKQLALKKKVLGEVD